jgi:hypothetical protein
MRTSTAPDLIAGQPPLTSAGARKMGGRVLTGADSSPVEYDPRTKETAGEWLK